MVLPSAQLFPNALLPLYIFEPRYRAMLTWSLEHDRMFCIAQMKPGINEARTTDEFHHTVGLGLIRASIQGTDGTSELVLLGLARMEITGFLQDAPFRIAELRELAPQPAPAAENASLSKRLLEAFAALFAGSKHPQATLAKELQGISDPAVLSDIIAHTCLRDPEARQAVFEEMKIAKRAALLLHYLSTESTRPEGRD